MIDWQPIATAPMDDRRVLVFGMATFEVGRSPKEPVILVARRNMNYIHHLKENHPTEIWQACDVSGYSTDVEATHWMPLPEPPK